MATVRISPKGEIRAIYADHLQPLLAQGEAKIERASHVEPDPDHPGQWLVDLSPVQGPIKKGFLTRGEALKWETDWLDANHLGQRPTA